MSHQRLPVSPSFSEMKRSLRYKRCLRHPNIVLEVSMVVEADDRLPGYRPMCIRCKEEGFAAPALGNLDMGAERTWTMVSKELQRTQGQPVLAKLTVEDVKHWLAPSASDTEINVFIRLCLAENLNPFARDVFLIPFHDHKTGQVTHAIVIGLQAYLKKASRNPQYETYQSGLIVQRAGQWVDTPGSALYPGDTLFGAWCKVWKKGASVPFEHRVSLRDWNKEQGLWINRPNVMIEVTAIRQAIRRAFPSEFGAFVTAETEGVAVEVVEDELATQLAPALPPTKVAIPVANPEPVICPIHNVPATLREGKWGPHYYHRDGAGWCNLKPEKYEQLWAERHSRTATPPEAPEDPSEPPPGPQDGDGTQKASSMGEPPMGNSGAEAGTAQVKMPDFHDRLWEFKNWVMGLKKPDGSKQFTAWAQVLALLGIKDEAQIGSLQIAGTVIRQLSR